MFRWLIRILKFFGILHDKKATICIIGLDNAGKTTLLHTIKTHHFVQFDQTKSYTKEEIKFGDCNMTCFDLGGHEYVRSTWKDYCFKANAIVFVIDAADLQRLDEAKEQLNKYMEIEELKDIPILVLGNKQDIIGSLSREELMEKLGIKQMTPLEASSKPKGERAIRVQMISAKQDFGYEVGFNWLARII